jgi:hypothetical protein
VAIDGGLVLIVSPNLKKSLDAMVVVLKQVTKGQFGSQVKVTINDEIGYVGDVEDSGQFMTLFYLTVDPENQSLQWVRAGHDPGIFYDPATDTFEDLKGKGPFGVLNISPSISTRCRLRRMLPVRLEISIYLRRDRGKANYVGMFDLL